MNSPSIKICVCTSNPSFSEPRAPRHATSLHNAGFEVSFIDAAPIGVDPKERDIALGVSVDHRKTIFFPTFKQNPFRSLFLKAKEQINRILFKLFSVTNDAILSVRVDGLKKKLIEERADIYYAHNIDTLLPAFNAAKKNKSKLVFDCMEYYSEMGEGHSLLYSKIVTAVEKKCLSSTILITASSQEVATEYQNNFSLTSTLAIYNKPSVSSTYRQSPGPGLRLYWRNAVLGLGQRGLDDILLSMKSLPEDVLLCIQGKPQLDGGLQIRQRISELGIGNRVEIKAPYSPNEAVQEASFHDVGLCLERSGIKNHELTVSNKLFDYMMAGLAVVASDLPGLATIVRAADSGILFRPGDAASLTQAILKLYEDRTTLERYCANARGYALREGNSEVEMALLVENFRELQSQIMTNAGAC